MRLLASWWGSSADLDEVQGSSADLVEKGSSADLEGHGLLEVGCTQVWC